MKLGLDPPELGLNTHTHTESRRSAPLLSALTPKAEAHMPVVRAALTFPRARRWPCALGITPSPPFSPTPSAQVYDKLVELKADVTAKANDGTTVLMHASMGGLTEVFPFLFFSFFSLRFRLCSFV